MFREGDILLWDGHIIEAVKKGENLVWQTFFAGSESLYYGSLEDVIYYNSEVGGSIYGDVNNASLFRPTKPDVVDKKYKSKDKANS